MIKNLKFEILIPVGRYWRTLPWNMSYSKQDDLINYEFLYTAWYRNDVSHVSGQVVLDK